MKVQSYSATSESQQQDLIVFYSKKIFLCMSTFGGLLLMIRHQKVEDHPDMCILCLFVCWSLTSLCHSNGHIETMPAREINPFTALTRIRSQFLRTQWSTSNHSEWTRLRIRPLSHRGWHVYIMQSGNWLRLMDTVLPPYIV